MLPLPLHPPLHPPEFTSLSVAPLVRLNFRQRTANARASAIFMCNFVRVVECRLCWLLHTACPGSFLLSPPPCCLLPAPTRVLCRLSLVKAARYPCIDLVCITCPTAKTSSPLSQIQFKFFSGIYFVTPLVVIPLSPPSMLGGGSW